MKLPPDAVIAAAKLSRYLLVKRAVGDKSDFLKRAGYNADDWKQLESDMRSQILTREKPA